MYGICIFFINKMINIKGLVYGEMGIINKMINIKGSVYGEMGII